MPSQEVILRLEFLRQLFSLGFDLCPLLSYSDTLFIYLIFLHNEACFTLSCGGGPVIEIRSISETLPVVRHKNLFGF